MRSALFGRSTMSVVMPLLLVGMSASLPAMAQVSSDAPVLYELTGASTFQRGCFDPCNCPITEQMPLVGTFKLSRVGFDGLFQVYSISDVSWDVNSSYLPLHVSGSGTYRVGGEFALMHRLELDLKVDGEAAEHFDSGLIPGGGNFPSIHAVVSVNDMVCYDTVITVDARPRPVQPPPLPRHACFVLHPGESSAELSLFTGGGRSKLTGSVRLFLGDPDVAVIALAGMVGLSVDGADLTAPDFVPDLPGIPEPLGMIQNPKVRSIGSWNTQTGQISFELSLIAPAGNLPVPMPLRLSGTLNGGVLAVSGNNGNVPDGSMSVVLKAFEVGLPPLPVDLWFSTEVPFHAGRISPAAAGPVLISAGDLLSRRGHIVRTNRELTRRLGIMPVVPDLGLDAAATGPRGEIWFSFEEEFGPLWSESLARQLKHGDLLSEAGYVVRTNEQLLAAFHRMPPVSDAGLDAVALAPDKGILFSTETGFFSESLGRYVSHGDLLCDSGRVVMTNQQLLQNFKIVDMTMRPVPADYGLDAVVLRPNGEIWFSTEVGFQVQRPDDALQLQWVSDGDLLSTRGYVVARNLDLLSAFAPIEDLANFGLDATAVVISPAVADLDQDGDVDGADLGSFQSAGSGPGVTSEGAVFGDFDGDGDIDQTDFGIFQRCLRGPDSPADPACAD
jgi:hypothetical protein